MTKQAVYEQQLASLFATRGKAKHRSRRTAAGFSVTSGQHYRAVFDTETGKLDLTILAGNDKRADPSRIGPVADGADALPADIAWRLLDE